MSSLHDSTIEAQDAAIDDLKRQYAADLKRQYLKQAQEFMMRTIRCRIPVGETEAWRIGPYHCLTFNMALQVCLAVQRDAEEANKLMLSLISRYREQSMDVLLMSMLDVRSRFAAINELATQTASTLSLTERKYYQADSNVAFLYRNERVVAQILEQVKVMLHSMEKERLEGRW